MRLENVIYGSEEYYKLSDENKLIVIELTLKELFETKARRTETVYIDGQKHIVPKNTGKRIKRICEERTALKKRCHKSIEILDDKSKKEGLVIRINRIPDRTRSQKDVDLKETEEELIIHGVFDKKDTSSDIQVEEKDDEVVFLNFFNQTLGKEKKDDKKYLFSLSEDSGEIEDINQNKDVILDLESVKKNSKDSEYLRLNKATYKKMTRKKRFLIYLFSGRKIKMKKTHNRKYLKPQDNPFVYKKKRSLFSDLFLPQDGKFLKPRTITTNNKKKPISIKKTIKQRTKGIIKELKNNNDQYRTALVAFGIAFLSILGLNGSSKRTLSSPKNIPNTSYMDSEREEDNIDKVQFSSGKTEYIEYSDNIEPTEPTELVEQIKSTESITNESDQLIIESSSESVETEVFEDTKIDEPEPDSESSNIENTEDENNIQQEQNYNDDLILFDSVIAVKENSRIYTNSFDAINHTKSVKARNSASMERIVVGVVFELNGKPEVVYRFSNNRDERINDLITQGAVEKSILITPVEFVNFEKKQVKQYEGYYDKDDCIVIDSFDLESYETTNSIHR